MSVVNRRLHLSMSKKDSSQGNNQSNYSLGTSIRNSTSQKITQRRLLFKSFAIIVSYILFGGIMYSIWLKEWTFIDALYFTVVTFTTVGYGDISIVNQDEVMTPSMKIVTTLFVLVGICIISNICLTVLTDSLVDSIDNMKHESENKSRETYVNKLFHKEGEEESVSKKEPTFFEDICKALYRSIPLIGVLLIPSIIVGLIEKWDVWTMIYYTVVTATTVGYGDFSPSNQYMRLFAIIYLPFMIIVFITILSNISGVYFDRKSKANEREYLKSRKLNISDLVCMDRDSGDGDGIVTYSEFLIFMLQAMEKLNKETDIEPLRELYESLDTDNNGHLTVNDIIAATGNSTPGNTHNNDEENEIINDHNKKLYNDADERNIDDDDKDNNSAFEFAC